MLGVAGQKHSVAGGFVDGLQPELGVVNVAVAVAPPLHAAQALGHHRQSLAVR